MNSSLMTPAEGVFEFLDHGTRKSAAERAALMTSPRFGTVFTDFMAQATWTQDGGWHDRQVRPYGPFILDPATAVFHYAQEIFEGMKAYRHPDGTVWCFRPEANAKRFRDSARRMALPELSEQDFIASITALIRADEAWVPTPVGGAEESLYLRPFLFASEAFVGVRPSRKCTYGCLASPVGEYFSSGVKPVSIWVSQGYNRAGPGGTGGAKCGGNYAASLVPQAEGVTHGCDQVCFLDAATGQYLEELGGMNLFLVTEDAVITPELSGTILPGITRDSIKQILQDNGRKVVERKISLSEWRDGIQNGSIREAFACGTGAVVTPIGRIAGHGFDLSMVAAGGEEMGEVTSGIRRELLDLQFGRIPDRHGWMRRIL